jgi:threonyl-tRNA synthetase
MLYTPHIANLDLWKTSGHCDFYKQDMFQPIEVDSEQVDIRFRSTINVPTFSNSTS